MLAGTTHLLRSLELVIVSSLYQYYEVLGIRKPLHTQVSMRSLSRRPTYHHTITQMSQIQDELVSLPELLAGPHDYRAPNEERSSCFMTTGTRNEHQPVPYGSQWTTHPVHLHDKRIDSSDYSAR
jgi:hypothetical protein